MADTSDSYFQRLKQKYKELKHIIDLAQKVFELGQKVTDISSSIVAVQLCFAYFSFWWYSFDSATPDRPLCVQLAQPGCDCGHGHLDNFFGTKWEDCCPPNGFICSTNWTEYGYSGSQENSAFCVNTNFNCTDKAWCAQWAQVGGEESPTCEGCTNNGGWLLILAIVCSITKMYTMCCQFAIMAKQLQSEQKSLKTAANVIEFYQAFNTIIVMIAINVPDLPGMFRRAQENGCLGEKAMELVTDVRDEVDSYNVFAAISLICGLLYKLFELARTKSEESEEW